MTESDQESTCQHTYEFLRQEKEVESEMRNWRAVKTFDVYFCASCLDYKRVHAQSSETDYDQERVTWRKGQ